MGGMDGFCRAFCDDSPFAYIFRPATGPAVWVFSGPGSGSGSATGVIIARHLAFSLLLTLATSERSVASYPASVTMTLTLPHGASWAGYGLMHYT